jgi:hypothetical protein
MNIAKSTLQQLKGFDIDNFDFQLALCKRLNLDDINQLVDKKLSNSQIIDLLKDYDFKQNALKILGQIELENSILPDGIEKLLLEQKIKVKGEIWVIHKNDADPLPSTPHAHNYDSGISLHLGTGEFFDKRVSKGFLDCKKLKFLRGQITFHTLPTLSERCQ